MRDLETLQEFLNSARSMPQCSRCGRTTAPSCWQSTGLSRGQAIRPVTRCSQAAEASAREALSARPVEDLPHVAAWREAYKSFGAKPQRTRNSLEALLRRAASGLPRVNRLTDIYNAVSVLHQVPLGGEDMTGYIGRPGFSGPPATEAF